MMEKGLTVGQYLQKYREAMEISLESVSKVTRINLSHLKALEKDEFYLLPAETFTLGYLRSYAKFIHLDPDQVVAGYRSQMEEKRKKGHSPELIVHPSLSLLKQSLNLLLTFTARFIGNSLAFPLSK